MNYQTLNSDEKTRLITTILDLVDELKEFDDFQETISLLCEDIPGLECLCQSLFDVNHFQLLFSKLSVLLSRSYRNVCFLQQQIVLYYT